MMLRYQALVHPPNIHSTWLLPRTNRGRATRTHSSVSRRVAQDDKREVSTTAPPRTYEPSEPLQQHDASSLPSRSHSHTCSEPMTTSSSSHTPPTSPSSPATNTNSTLFSSTYSMSTTEDDFPLPSTSPHTSASSASPSTIFDTTHIGSLTPQLLLYLPFGIILASFRMALWIAGIAIDSPSFTNPTIVQTYLQLLGYSVRWSGLENLPKGRHVLVSNHVSVGDLMMLFRMPQRYVHLVTSALPEATTKTKHLPAVLKPASPQIMEQLSHWQSDVPVHIFPEGGMTNGQAMLQFSRGFTKLLAPGIPVVPVAIRMSNTFNINTHTLDSSFLANLFWFSFSPATTVEAVVLPAMEPQEGEGRGAFVQRVQQALAQELGVPVAEMNIQQKRKYAQMVARRKAGGR